MEKQFLVGVDTNSNPPFELSPAHAHSVVGTYELKDFFGNIAHRLYHIRNPYGNDRFEGKFNDDDPIWSESYKS